MELVIFIGIPASGKSTFYQKYFFRSHMRVNLDMSVGIKERKNLRSAVAVRFGVNVQQSEFWHQNLVYD